jgi:hypothetical protein
VLEKRGNEISQQRFPVLRGSAQLSVIAAVPHRKYSF